MPKLRERGPSYSKEYVISIPTPLVEEEMGWEKGDVLEWRRVEGGLKLFLVRKGRRKKSRRLGGLTRS